MFAQRAFFIWLVIVFLESLHGIIRTLFLAPLVGDFRARQIAVFSGTLLIFAVAYLFIRWMRAETVKQLFAVGTMWLILTFLFEVGLGSLLGYSRERIFEDYDLSRGGLMGFGLLFMLFAPLLAAKFRGIN